MELVKGIPLLYQQFKSLFYKNIILSWRNKSATFLQLFSSLFFIFLLFCIDKATVASNNDTTAYQTILNPEALVSPAIPSCDEKFYIKKPCFDFVWSGNDSARLTRIISSVMSNNPGRVIPSTKVKSFRTPDDVDVWLLNNPMQCPGALHFREVNASIISYGIQTNSTPVRNRGLFEDPVFKFQIPLQIAAEREIARSVIGDANFSWVVGLKEFAHPAKEASDTLATVGPVFFLAFAMFGFVMQIGSLVAEKELKLRQAMSLTGLYDSMYWFSWITWEGILTLISSLLLILFGMMFQFDFFKKNSFAVVFLVFFLFQFNMIGFAFMLSTFISKSSSATTVGFSIFIVGFITQVATVAGFPYGFKISSAIRFVWSLFPPNLFALSMNALAEATATREDVGISWSRRKDCVSDASTDDGKCAMSINNAYVWLICTFFAWFALAIYFDNIFPNAYGVRKSVFYFLNPGYWTGSGGNKSEEGGICSCMSSVPQQVQIPPEDEDVLEEENNVKQDAREGITNPNVAVQVRGILKTYAGTTKIGCCKCKKTSPYHALKGLWVNFAKDQLFCLLGPNGAGKTTAINCLTGITPVTGGDALIYGNSIRSSVGMSNIQRIIGVCPQFDILWDALSGEEHLHLFASIKGLSSSSINSVVQESLANVRLTESAKVRTRSYSGGMRRRLSVAIALIGDPKLVILDEPTTGMDPISRRHVWDIIQNAKKGRSIVLTTHSMEEADILSDRIGIMAKGRLRCIGNSIRLKSKFGTGFITNVSFTESNSGRSPPNGTADTINHCEDVKQFFKNHLDIMPAEETKSFLTFVIPHDRERLLTKVFADLQDRQAQFGIADIQIGLTTLEEVFLNIARQAELESAAAEGRLVPLTLTSGPVVQIPVGARFVGIPGTETPENPRGIMVEVYWEQDDTGTLCISGHSAEMPMPPNARPLISAPPTNNRHFLGQSRPVYGIVIDPSQTSGTIS
ncbi:ABC transporter A family member 2 [Mercurialis annua]|uniref:ABC transporter A family member 2 n=1 Tax=Mercurialis annua TaxID=3986 RepID=UPI002160883B|nr:ABC transporter A family member 2 [Mercurialis annua]